jgi:CRP/FNR family transcriptional regulator, cyclic AMP receptor protein
VLITQGAADSDIFFILAGSVTVVSNGRGEGIILRAPTHVGEMATIDCRVRRSATVRANEPTVAARVTGPEFTRIANAHPFIWRQFAIEMGERLRQRLATFWSSAFSLERSGGGAPSWFILGGRN